MVSLYLYKKKVQHKLKRKICKNFRRSLYKICHRILPSYLLDHLEELRFTLPPSSLFIFLLEQIEIITPFLTSIFISISPFSRFSGTNS